MKSLKARLLAPVLSLLPVAALIATQLAATPLNASELGATWIPGFPSIFAPTAPAPTLEPLPHLSVDLNRITVSGVSSGGFMAVQLHVAHSALFRGAASIAGGIYECAKGDVNRSQNVCMNGPNQIQVSEHTALAEAHERNGDIDSLSHLRDSRVYIFASKNDFIIKPAGSDKLEEFYKNFSASITRKTHANAAHGFLTNNYGNLCSIMGSPWMLKCQYDMAGEVLQSTEPATRVMAQPSTADKSSVLYFDQSALVGPDARMFNWGAAYIPKKCRTGAVSCGVHVALHGCQMNPDFIDRQFIENAGYNEWAESNDLIVLYPQSAKSNGNPYACWDWFGFSGPAYTTKKGKQIEAIRKILSALGA